MDGFVDELLLLLLLLFGLEEKSEIVCDALNWPFCKLYKIDGIEELFCNGFSCVVDTNLTAKFFRNHVVCCSDDATILLHISNSLCVDSFDLKFYVIMKMKKNYIYNYLNIFGIFFV
jgi:hypothetical protein